MNWNQVEGNWKQLVGQAQARWGKLTGDELESVKGRQKELAGLIQERYGKTEEEATRELDDWMASINHKLS
ncbi:CsbD family protein [Roseibium aestuarii]|uniref:CsbD family protein n=1 Tax=Roseibium aestuarii TaxID=2600299 RepID=A0ABW4JX84_9HYPH|nr:CsbD family protein [Roseibium aestuarii]